MTELFIPKSSAKCAQNLEALFQRNTTSTKNASVERLLKIQALSETEFRGSSTLERQNHKRSILSRVVAEIVAKRLCADFPLLDSRLFALKRSWLVSWEQGNLAEIVRDEVGSHQDAPPKSTWLTGDLLQSIDPFRKAGEPVRLAVKTTRRGKSNWQFNVWAAYPGKQPKELQHLQLAATGAALGALGELCQHEDLTDLMNDVMRDRWGDPKIPVPTSRAYWVPAEVSLESRLAPVERDPVLVLHFLGKAFYVGSWDAGETVERELSPLIQEFMED